MPGNDALVLERLFLRQGELAEAAGRVGSSTGKACPAGGPGGADPSFCQQLATALTQPEMRLRRVWVFQSKL